jgi:ABC-type Na+ efflux pump permease subunit
MLTDESTSSYSDAINTYFRNLTEGTGNNQTKAIISIYSDPRIIMSQTTAYQFKENVLPRYKDYLIKTAGSSFYSEGGGAPFAVDIFNPYTRLMEYRSLANPMGARVIPGILLLLLYYCVYALSGDILAADRERGFLAKLTLTPLSTRGLLWGKGLAVAGVSSLTSLITLLVLLLSSWTNRSNNPLSLIPFGLLLTPAQLILIIGSIICAAIVMTMFCFKVILDLHNMQDIIMNLQLPLLFFLVDFFLQLFRTSTPVWVEYAIPLHNNLLLIHDIMAGTAYLPFYAAIIIFNIVVAFFLYRNIKRTFEQESGNRRTRLKFGRRTQ